MRARFRAVRGFVTWLIKAVKVIPGLTGFLVWEFGAIPLVNLFIEYFGFYFKLKFAQFVGWSHKPTDDVEEAVLFPLWLQKNYDANLELTNKEWVDLYFHARRSAKINDKEFQALRQVARSVTTPVDIDSIINAFADEYESAGGTLNRPRYY